ncbi:helix-turn-helix domain-containing protein [Azospirillum brasilense]|uniref:helix-turn-helix domain-containing protein n=1 Tax=Azospirillum brasilense TaxID=192 RepID=UPI001EDC653B|nr:helix-turn-helix transcriptional regulator [Azospirillum brasilense]UKJ78239.1 helix-turn-helix transcriptional regulator [Azospirillum brasilense]
MTPTQCKTARRRLGWSIEELAHRAMRSPTVVGEFERGKKPASAAVLASLRRAFAEAGVDAEAIPADDGNEAEDAACSR